MGHQQLIIFIKNLIVMWSMLVDHCNCSLVLWGVDGEKTKQLCHLIEEIKNFGFRQFLVKSHRMQEI